MPTIPSFTAIGSLLGGLRGWAYTVIHHYNINNPLSLSKVKYVFGKAYIYRTASNKKCFIKVDMRGDYVEEIEQ